MTTASIYYQNNMPNMVVIGGDGVLVRLTDEHDGEDWRLRAVADACRQLGWQPLPHALIVRQADGRGTVRIEPVSSTPGEPPRQRNLTAVVGTNAAGIPHTVVVDDPAKGGPKTERVRCNRSLSGGPDSVTMATRAVKVALAVLGYHTTGPIGPVDTRFGVPAEGIGDLARVVSIAEDATGDPVDKIAMPIAFVSILPEGDLGRVAVDGQTAPLPPGLSGTGDQPSGAAIAAIDRALDTLGYERTSPLGWDASEEPAGIRWVCHVRAYDATRHLADWRDNPTLIRMDDDTAKTLQSAAEKLDIPADVLASGWIRTAAAAAHMNHKWFTDSGIVDQSRIVGWLPDGTPRTKGA